MINRFPGKFPIDIGVRKKIWELFFDSELGSTQITMGGAPPPGPSAGPLSVGHLVLPTIKQRARCRHCVLGCTTNIYGSSGYDFLFGWPQQNTRGSHADSGGAVSWCLSRSKPNLSSKTWYFRDFRDFWVKWHFLFTFLRIAYLDLGSVLLFFEQTCSFRGMIKNIYI